jgi:pimeloyl-ACP methyl ester carboxylesterase
VKIVNRVLSYDEVGQGEKILFLHGYISDRRIWSRVKECWNGTGHLFFPTLGGFGQESQDVSSSDFSFDRHMDDVVAFLETVCTTPAHLVGWSYGATLALAVAARRPDLVKSVFAFEAGLSSFISDQDILQRVQLDRADMAGQAIEVSERGDVQRAVQHIVDCACSQEGLFEGLDGNLKQIFLDNANTVPLMFTKQSAPNVPVTAEELQSISCPVTVSFGEYARPAYRLVAEEAAEIIPHATAQMIPAALHVIPITSPDVFQQAVLEHLTVSTSTTSDV